MAPRDYDTTPFRNGFQYALEMAQEAQTLEEALGILESTLDLLNMNLEEAAERYRHRRPIFPPVNTVDENGHPIVIR